MSQENHRHEQADHVREAVAEHLEDLEDRFTAEAALLANRQSNEPALTLDDLDAERDLLR